MNGEIKISTDISVFALNDFKMVFLSECRDTRVFSSGRNDNLAGIGLICD